MRVPSWSKNRCSIVMEDILKCEMRLVPLGVGVLGVAACNAVLGLGNYRPCENAECSDAADATTDALGKACTKSSECNAGDGNVVCSHARCTSVIGLSRGMGDFSCAILSDHTARCWGRNSSGQLGNGKLGG